ncbi:hypothetical protein HDV03_001189 [Kappamyces sp. JEL0829]|nr:hypothetical protein HDV03_001189 [Kappamyces sp. JEL0829]
MPPDQFVDSAPAGYIKIGQLADFSRSDSVCTPVAVEGIRGRLNITWHDSQLKASSNICPHQGNHGGGNGIKWGSAIECHLHGWSFSLDSGICGTNSFILPIYPIVVLKQDQSVWVGTTPSNLDQPGPRRDFYGQELVYDASSGAWV